jgi:hypothetical protein
MNATPGLVAFLTSPLELDDDMDEDDEDEDDDSTEDEDDDEDDSDLDDDEEEPETWQVSAGPRQGNGYPERGTCACESPNRRVNLTFRLLTA